MRAFAQHRFGEVEALAHGGFHRAAMRLRKRGESSFSASDSLRVSRGIAELRDRNRRQRRSAKHCSCGPAQENLLQGQPPIGDKLDGDDLHPSPLNALRAFEAAARHLSFKLAAHELHVTPAAVGQQVKALEARLGVRLFERLHKQLVLTEAGQAYLPEVSGGFRRIANATEQLKPVGAVLLQLGVHGSFDLRRLELERVSRHACRNRLAGAASGRPA